MLRGKGFLVLLAATALVAVGAAFTLKREAPVPEAGTLVFPGLLERLNDVVRVDVTSAGETFTLQRAAGGWVAPGRSGYRLEGDKVHNLMVGAAGLTRLQPKTAKPERFAELGLRDPADKESRAVRFVLMDASDQSIASLIVGERRPAKGDATRTEYYVRLPAEERSWLVLGTLPEAAGETVDWLDRQVIRLGGPRIARVRVTHPDGEVVTAERAAPGAEDFSYAELPEGAELDGLWRINDLGRVLTDLDLDEVKAAATAITTVPEIEVVTETYDGLRVRMLVTGDKEQPLARLSAEFDEALVHDVAGASPPVDVKTPEQVRQEVETLNARWKGWVYVLPGFKFDYVTRRQADMIKQPEAKPAG